MGNSLAEKLAAVFGGTIGMLTAIFIGAVVLRVSCMLYNLLAGDPDKPSGPTSQSEPETDVIGHPEANDENWAEYQKNLALPGVPRPTLERAMRIIFFAALVNITGSFIVYRILRLMGLASASGTLRSLSILLFFIPLGILVLGGMIAAMLPTSSGKGMLVALLYHLLFFLIVAVLGAAAILIARAFGMNVGLFS